MGEKDPGVARQEGGSTGSLYGGRASSELEGRGHTSLPEAEEPVETGWSWEATCGLLLQHSQLCNLVKSGWEVASGSPRKLSLLCTPVKSGGGPRAPTRWAALEPRGTRQGRLGQDLGGDERLSREAPGDTEKGLSPRARNQGESGSLGGLQPQGTGSAQCLSQN